MQNQPKQPATPTNVQDLIKRGGEIYETLKENLESEHSGKYVVIEVDSGKHFLGETRDEAISNARKEFPEKIMFIRRVGQTEKVSRHLSNYRIRHARIL